MRSAIILLCLSFSLRGEATPAGALDVQVLALKAGSGFVWKAKAMKSQMGRAMSEMRDLDFICLPPSLIELHRVLGRALLV